MTPRNATATLGPLPSVRSLVSVLLLTAACGLGSACGSSSAGLDAEPAGDGGAGRDTASDRTGGADDRTSGRDGGSDVAETDATGLDGAAPPDGLTADGPLPDGGLTDGGPPGEPITTPSGQWTWVDFPDSTCDDGSPTGIGVNLAESDNLLIFLNGGGACWDYRTCFVLNTAAHGPFGAAQFAVSTPAFTGNILDRADAQNPFREWNMVFVPYCTGDVHAGDNEAEYEGQTYQHRGRANLRAYLRRLTATVTPDKLVFSGSSAGGFGAGMNYDLARQAFPDAQGYLLDDSGPPLIGDDIGAGLRDAWYASWRLDLALDELCPDCRDDFSALLPVLAARYPDDRLALLSSKQDQVIRTYFQKSASEFEAALDSLASEVLDPIANGRYFFVPGASHTMLGSPAVFVSPAGVALWTWLDQMVNDSADWSTQSAP